MQRSRHREKRIITIKTHFLLTKLFQFIIAVHLCLFAVVIIIIVVVTVILIVVASFSFIEGQEGVSVRVYKTHVFKQTSKFLQHRILCSNNTWKHRCTGESECKNEEFDATHIWKVEFIRFDDLLLLSCNFIPIIVRNLSGNFLCDTAFFDLSLSLSKTNLKSKKAKRQE